jgi:LysR family glycine cleavage system transcriptional activator
MTSGIENSPDARHLDTQLLSDLWVFRAAARLGSVTAAAQRLNVSQGAVSQRILRLEGRLGTPLFIRQKGRMALTDSGRSLLEAMSQVAQVLNDSLSRIERLQRKAIVVSCVPSLATEWLVPHLEEFYQLHPGIEVFVRSEMVPSTPERLEDEGIDLIIDYQPEQPAGLHQLAELQEYVFPVCSPRYRDKLDTTGSPDVPTLLQDDLSRWGAQADYEWSSWRSGSGSDWPGRQTPVRHFNLAVLANHAAMCGQGVAIGRAVLVARLLANGELVRAVDGDPVAGSVYRVLTNRPGDARSAVRQFARWWSEAMARTQANTLSLLAADQLPSE